jgi:hypothetical protein
MREAGVTKEHAIVFLADAGHITDVTVIDENAASIGFKFMGWPITLFTYEDDPNFLFLRCSYVLDDTIRNELEVLRTLARIQDRAKVAKLSASIAEAEVSATAELFLPACADFAAVFWRSVDVVARVASEAHDELNSTGAAEVAAERFTEELEAELHLKKPDGD